MKKPVVGVIGLGQMGGGIARCLRRADIPIAVWDVNDLARAGFAGLDGAVVSPPEQMAKTCRLVLFVVPGSAEIRSCLNGRQGLLANAHGKLVLCDLTTSDPKITRKLARRAAARGLSYLDAGMSGGAAAAAAGTLTLMLGGDRQAYRRMSRYFDIIAGTVFYLGESGAGHTMKLAHNMVCHSIFVATGEGARLAEKAGINLADAIDVFNAGNARSYVSEARFPNHIISETWDARSRIHNLNKDVAMAVTLSDELGVRAAVGRQTSRFLGAAVNRGMAELDFSLLYRDFDAIAKAAADEDGK
ncbi:MAG: NAD(P)-dependent oxidoreductase [Rhodospirillales bacterium]|nr:NAD(P)-dependent oxidoreductase [Rhodospirillales bacterium]